jgi:hypothetical protein
VGIEDLELPGGVRIEAPNPIAVQIVNVLAPLLQSISNQLDLMIRLECGQKSKSEVKTMINIFDAQVRQAQNGEVPQQAPEEKMESMVRDAIAKVSDEEE